MACLILQHCSIMPSEPSGHLSDAQYLSLPCRCWRLRCCQPCKHWAELCAASSSCRGSRYDALHGILHTLTEPTQDTPSFPSSAQVSRQPKIFDTLGVCADGTGSGGRLSMPNAPEEEITEPLIKYSVTDWLVPADMDLDDDSLFVEPIAPMQLPPKYKSSEYCTYKPPEASDTAS